jgi:hypothetical protein
VIGFGRGGLTETVRPRGAAGDPTGVLFSEQSLEAVVEAMEDFERHADRFDPKSARRQAVLFCKERFERELFNYLDEVMEGSRPKARAAA